VIYTYSKFEERQKEYVLIECKAVTLAAIKLLQQANSTSAQQNLPDLTVSKQYELKFLHV